MKKNIHMLLVLLLLCAYVLIAYPDQGFASLADFFDFNAFAEKVVTLIGMSLLIILTMGPPGQGETNRSTAKVWLSGGFAVLGITTITIMIANPLGAFPWNTDNHAGAMNARVDKIPLYKQLTSMPDVVFLGTSVSFPLPAQEYAQRFSLSGFNFSLDGATPVDYITIMNLILSDATTDNRPKIIITEILAPNLASEHGGTKFYNALPLEGVAYAPFPFSLRIVSSHFIEVFDLASFSSAIFVKYFAWQGERPTIYFGVDGTSLYPSEGPKTGYDQARFVRTSSLLHEFLFCTELDNQGKDLISRMAALSKKHGLKLIFYRPPINDDFYKLTDDNPATYKRKSYKRCANKLEQFMQAIQSEYPNVLYVDLSHYPPISSGGRALYLDADHFTAQGMDRLLEVLTPIIKEHLE
jgi:hypothetical protein